MKTLLLIIALLTTTTTVRSQDILSYDDGVLTFTTTNTQLFYSVEFKPNLSTHAVWTNNLPANIQSTNASASAPVGQYYRVVGRSNIVTGVPGDASPTDVQFGKTFSNAEGTGLEGQRAGGTIVNGTFSPLKRWCDNGDGTLADTTTGLIWLKNTLWAGIKVLKWDSNSQDDAMTRVTTLQNGLGGLTDGSVLGDWRLPTISELKKIVTGLEPVQQTTPRFFTGLTTGNYWSSTTVSSDTSKAYLISMFLPLPVEQLKRTNFASIPVRSQ